MKKNRPTLLEFLDKIPPCLTRVMAVECGKGKRPRLRTLDEIVVKSGLSRRTVQRLASRKTWADVRLSVASSFIAACGIDPLHKSDAYQFARQYADKNFHHLDALQRKRIFTLMGWEQ